MQAFEVLQQLLIAQNFGVQVPEVHKGTIGPIERQHVARQPYQAGSPPAIVVGSAGTCQPGALECFVSSIDDRPQIIPVLPKPPCRRAERCCKHLSLQSRPREAVERFDPVFQRDDLAIQAIKLFARTLTGHSGGRREVQAMELHPKGYPGLTNGSRTKTRASMRSLLAWRW
ncbi:MAG: hypothetical protein NVSMB42_08010 [Herpetosiphon sp.]